MRCICIYWIYYAYTFSDHLIRHCWSGVLKLYSFDIKVANMWQRSIFNTLLHHNQLHHKGWMGSTHGRANLVSSNCIGYQDEEFFPVFSLPSANSVIVLCSPDEIQHVYLEILTFTSFVVSSNLNNCRFLSKSVNSRDYSV